MVICMNAENVVTSLFSDCILCLLTSGRTVLTTSVNNFKRDNAVMAVSGCARISLCCFVVAVIVIVNKRVMLNTKCINMCRRIRVCSRLSLSEC